MDYTEFKEEINHDLNTTTMDGVQIKETYKELLKAMRMLWHEIDTSEGAEAWILINDFINQPRKSLST